MKRSAGVTVVAVFALLGSLLTLAMGCLMGVAFLFSPPDKSLDASMQPMLKVGMIGGLVFLAAFSAWGIASAIGLFRLRQWARISTLIFSGLLIFFGVVSPLVILAIPMPPTAGADPAIMTGVKIGLAIFYLCFAAIGAWWMIYLTRPSVKAQFATGALPGQPSRRPISIAIIGWFLIVGACFTPINWLLHIPMLLFGLMLTGWKATLCLLIFGAISLIAGVGLLRLREESRLLAISYLVFSMCNALVTWLLPGAPERLGRMMESMPAMFHTPTQPTLNPLIMALLGMPIFLVVVYFLVKHKKAFVPVATAELTSSFLG